MNSFLTRYRRTQAQRAMDRRLTDEMRRAIEIMDRDGAVIAGDYIERGCKKRPIQASTLRALALRRIATLDASPDGNVMARRRTEPLAPLVSPPCPACGYDRASAGKCAGCGEKR